MGKFDGILNAFKINNDDDDYEDDYDGYDDPEYEAPAKSSKSSRKSDASNGSDDYDEPKKASKGFWSTKSSSKNNSKKGPENMEVSIFYPKTLDAATQIVDSLLDNKSVIMNLEGIPMEVAMRIFDLITGATYALDGRLESISKYVYVVTPQNVNISGDTNSDDSAVPIGKGFPV